MVTQAVSFMVLPRPSLPASFQNVQHLSSSWPCCHFVQIAPSQTAVMASTNGDQTWRKNVYPCHQIECQDPPSSEEPIAISSGARLQRQPLIFFACMWRPAATPWCEPA